MKSKNIALGICLLLVLLACARQTPRPRIPGYPNQSNLTTTITPGAGYEGETISFLTTDAEPDIREYYATHLPEAGWSESGYNWENGLANDGLHYGYVHGCPVYYLAIQIVQTLTGTAVAVQLRTYPCT
jgi:hypothetical protein